MHRLKPNRGFLVFLANLFEFHILKFVWIALSLIPLLIVIQSQDIMIGKCLSSCGNIYPNLIENISQVKSECGSYFIDIPGLSKYTGVTGYYSITEDCWSTHFNLSVSFSLESTDSDSFKSCSSYTTQDTISPLFENPSESFCSKWFRLMLD